MRFRSRGQTSSRSQGNATPEILIAISKIRQMAGFCWIMLFNTDWAPQNGCHVLSRHDVKRMAVRLVRELFVNGIDKMWDKIKKKSYIIFEMNWRNFLKNEF